MIRDFTDAEARQRLVLKWGIVPDDVLPAWVAEMDFAVHEPIRTAVGDAVAGSALGKPGSPVCPAGAMCLSFDPQLFYKGVEYGACL